MIISKVNEEVNELLYNFDVNDIEDSRIEKYVNNLNSHSKKCNQISESINNALDHLNLLLENYSQVSVKTRSLHVACEQLLNDQVCLFFLLLIFILNIRVLFSNFILCLIELDKTSQCIIFVE